MIFNSWQGCQQHSHFIFLSDRVSKFHMFQKYKCFFMVDKTASLFIKFISDRVTKFCVCVYHICFISRRLSWNVDQISCLSVYDLFWTARFCLCSYICVSLRVTACSCVRVQICSPFPSICLCVREKKEDLLFSFSFE